MAVVYVSAADLDETSDNNDTRYILHLFRLESMRRAETLDSFRNIRSRVELPLLLLVALLCFFSDCCCYYYHLLHRY